MTNTELDLTATPTWVHRFADDVTEDAIRALPEDDNAPRPTAIARIVNGFTPDKAADLAATVRRHRAGWTDATAVVVRALDMRAAGMTVTGLAISGQA